jgi:predicted dehydrogenase
MNVLLIGLGSVAKKHIEALRAIDASCHMEAFRSQASSTVLAGVRNIVHLKDATAPDFIIICNPTSLHRTTIQDVLQFGCPLFIEKPIFDQANEIEEELVTRLRDNKISTYVGCNLRFHPAIKFAKDLLKTNPDKIEEVSVYSGSYLPEWRPGTEFRKSYSANADMGGGVHLDLVHELDYVHYLFGSPLSSISRKSSASSLRINSADSARYFLDYQDFSVGITLNYFRKQSRRDVEIVRSNDIIKIDLLNATVVELLTGQTLFRSDHYSVLDTYKTQMRYFIEHKDEKMMNNADEAFGILKIALI